MYFFVFYFQSKYFNSNSDPFSFFFDARLTLFDRP